MLERSYGIVTAVQRQDSITEEYTFHCIFRILPFCCTGSQANQWQQQQQQQGTVGLGVKISVDEHASLREFGCSNLKGTNQTFKPRRMSKNAQKCTGVHIYGGAQEPTGVQSLHGTFASLK